MLRKEDVLHVAELARLSLSKQEVERYTEQLNQILSAFRSIQDIPTDDVPPTTHVAPLELRLHDDEVADCLTPEQWQKTGATTQEGLVRVPKVLDDD